MPFLRLLLTVCVAAALALAPRPSAGLRPMAKHLSTPDLGKIAYEDVTFAAADGVKLHGWFMPFQDQDGRTIHEPAPVLLLPTDGSDNMSSVLWHYFTFLRGTPWHVLAFDWRGFGKSGAWAIDTTEVAIPEMMLDLEAAIEYAKERHEFDGQHVGLFAAGPGAAVALAVASKRKDIGALALRGVYTTQAEYCAARTAAEPGRRCLPNRHWPAELEPLAVAPSVKSPVLLIVGEDDAVTPPAMARKVHAALAGPKELWIAPAAGHTAFHSPEYVHQRPFALKMHSFFKRFLGTGK